MCCSVERPDLITLNHLNYPAVYAVLQAAEHITLYGIIRTSDYDNHDYDGGIVNNFDRNYYPLPYYFT